MTFRRGAAPPFILLLGVVGGIVGSLLVVQGAASDDPTIKYVAGFVGGFIALIHIVKEVRALLGFPTRRRADDNLVREVAEVNRIIGEMKTDYAGLAQILENAGKEIERLRDASDGVEDRISRAMSKVASQMQTTVTALETRLLVVERRRH